MAERGDAPSAHKARARLARLLELDGHLNETFKDRDGRLVWLDEPSRYLGGIRPTEAIRSGRADRVEAALEALDSGVFV